MWLCIEEGMSIFFCGETASGKTTTMGAALSFIKHESKIYTAEDTIEMQVPHKVWQRLATRDFGPEESRVDTFALLKAALRSRPNYIIVGEIRGKEGSVAFQAMQTGHPVLATFHAASTRKLVQRFTSDPDQRAHHLHRQPQCGLLPGRHLQGRQVPQEIAVHR